ncbi:MAG: putative Zn finger-like uncharacterized protein [Paracoccaceae bacterium]|jgi:predicted Zn finger-like uncharacterized protein
MRLTCPNCGAQYEVPDEVIPSEGRDVQCSNCGDTWFQNHADSPNLTEAKPEQTPPQAAEPDVDEEETEQAPAQTQLDSSVKNILREEAAHEAQIRADETGNSIESQPDLGLDDIAYDAERRAQEAQDRVARIRGTEIGHGGAPAEADPISIPRLRRGLLPDIEEINSTLHADSNKPDLDTAVGPISASTQGKRKSGFTRGFAVAILIAAGLVMIYVRAPQIAQSFPKFDPALNAYVAGVDKSRLWLDNKIGDLIPNKGE